MPKVVDLNDSIEIHFIVNRTMESMAQKYFIASMPNEFIPVRHGSDAPTSGEYAQDGYFDVLVEKIDWILSVLEERLDGTLILWSDVDIVFNKDCLIERRTLLEEVRHLAVQKDLLFQMEDPEGYGANTGFQVIRKTARVLMFYKRVRLMLEFFSRSEQACVNRLLGIVDGVKWSNLPPSYANGSNGGLTMHNRLYHATCTHVDSQRSKVRSLENALSYWSAGSRHMAV